MSYIEIANKLKEGSRIQWGYYYCFLTLDKSGVIQIVNVVTAKFFPYEESDFPNLRFL